MIYLLILMVLTLLALAVWRLRLRSMDRWLPAYMAGWPRRRLPRPDEPVHLLLCVADHYEPFHAGACREQARARVQRWVEEYHKLFARFMDSDGRPPRHTFFYPIEQYDAELLDALAVLCRRGYGEVEVHLHHDNDTAANLHRTLTEFRELLAARHGLLPRDRRTGVIQYGFIHGNWALDNSRPDGRYCGVSNELEVLKQTGCYADFTLPSAPSPTQTRIINSIYYARGGSGRCKAHDRGIIAGTATTQTDALLLIQGPLGFNWRRRKWGLLPRLENGCLQASQPPDIARLPSWLRARVQVPHRPDWYFVKLHAHGAPEESHMTLLGEPMVRFHEALAQLAARHPAFHFHYVTAREMCNLVHAAEEGWRGSVADARDYRLVMGKDFNLPHRPAAQATDVPQPVNCGSVE
jgi:hypothetical protein